MISKLIRNFRNLNYLVSKAKIYLGNGNRKGYTRGGSKIVFSVFNFFSPMVHFGGGGEENHEGAVGERQHNHVVGGPTRSMTSEGWRFEISPPIFIQLVKPCCDYETKLF